MLIGPLIILMFLIVAFLLSIPAASHAGLQTWGSLAASSTAFVAMALNQFLATRPRFLEGFFGGLDRMYRNHKTLGKIALVLILVHYFITPVFNGQLLTSGLNLLAKNAAKIGFWMLIILIAFSLFKKIPFTKIEVPYHIWRQSHRFIGVAFTFIVFHQMFIKRPFDGNALLVGYLNLFAVIGIVSFIYTQLAPIFRKKNYTVTKVDKQADAILLSAMPVSKSIKTKPGQFAIINFKKSGLREPHPFSVAKQKDNGEISFAIKSSGDFTKILYDSAQKGDQMQIEGGYGRFKFDPSNSRQLWLAGGIGITPFLAMSASLNNDLKQDICLVHCVRTADEGISFAELKKQAKNINHFHYALYCSDKNGHLNATKLIELVDFELDGASLMFCGPSPLRFAIVKALSSMGKKLSSKKFELFEFR